jgi:hypothetical protein
VQVLVAGVAVRLEASSPAELLELRDALALAPCTDDPPAFVLRLATGGLPQPRRRPDRAVQHVRYWDEGDDRDAVLVAPGPGRTARVSAGCGVLDPGDGGVTGIHALLLPVLALLFAQQAACLVHGATFLHPRLGAVLALGGSGRGKSTLVAAALEKGLPVLTDDLMVLRLCGGAAVVSGVPQPLALPGDQAHLSVVGAPMPNDPRGRREASAVALAAGTHRVGAVLVVEHSDRQDGHLRPAQGSDVLRALLTSTLEGLTPGQARNVFPYAATVARLPAWHLGHAADPAERIPAAQRRLEEIGSTNVLGRRDEVRLG